MIGGVINGVDADGVDVKLGEIGDVSHASCCVGKGVGFYAGSPSRLVIDAADVEAVGAVIECWEFCEMEIQENGVGRGGA